MAGFFKRVAFIALACAVCSAWGELVLADRQANEAATIVIRAQATPCERYAAEELRDHLAKVTGVTPRIANDGGTLPAKAILLGATAHTAKVVGERGDVAKTLAGLGDDGFRLLACPPHLVVLGSEKRGVLYGVYEILEKYAGCRWYASWHSVIPTREKIAVEETLDRSETPAFAMRVPRWFDLSRHPEFSARLRVDGAGSGPDGRFGRDRYTFGKGLGNSHTFQTLMPPDEFFDSHPEYFSLVKGKRLKHPSQLCLTNPDVLRIVTERVLERIRQDPGKSFYGVSQNDWYNYCECDACKAIDDEEESHAGTMVRFVNAVAEAVEKEFPAVLIETLAYQYTRKPPKKTRLRPNVVPCLCSIECDFALPIAENKYKENVSFRDDIIGWSAQTSNLYIWDYVTNFNHYPLPFANVLSLQDNLRFFKANGTRHIFEQGANYGHHGDFAELKGWLLAKWMWNPELPLEDLLNDFFPGYYGAGAPYVRKYFDELHRHQQDYSRSGEHPLRFADSSENPALSDAFLMRALKLWKKALDATKGDSATHKNVRMGAFAVKYMIFEHLRMKHNQVAWLSSEPVNEKAVRGAQEMGRELLRLMDEDNIVLAENPRSNRERVAAWKKFVARPMIVPAQRAVIEESDISHEPEGRRCIEADDATAENGRALKLFNDHFKWCGFVYANAIKFDVGATYSVRVRVRVDKASDGKAFWTGIYDPAAKKDLIHIVKTTAETSSEYRWYDLGTWRATGTEYFWIGPGPFEPGAQSAVKAVWVDKIEIAKLGNQLTR